MSEIRTCQHLHTNGNLCQSPALRHNSLCYFHYRLAQREQRRIKLGGPCSPNGNTGIELPLLEDAESIQVAIIEVAKALVDQRIDEKRAGLLLYSFQLALQNLPNLKAQKSDSGPYVLDAKQVRWEGALEEAVDPDSETFHRTPSPEEAAATFTAVSEPLTLKGVLRKLGFEDADSKIPPRSSIYPRTPRADSLAK